MSTPSEDPEEGMAGDGGASEQESPARQGRASSYPPPPPGASVEVRGTVRVSNRPPPASDGNLQLDLVPEEDTKAREATEVGELEIELEASEGAPEAPAYSAQGDASDGPADGAPAESEAPEIADPPDQVAPSPAVEEASEPSMEAQDSATHDTLADEGASADGEEASDPPMPDEQAVPLEQEAVMAAAPEEAPVEELPEEALAHEDAEEGSHADAAAPSGASSRGSADLEVAAEELEIEEVEPEEDAEALELQEVEAEEVAEEVAQETTPAPEPPAPPGRKRKRPWFEAFFNDDYLRTVPPPTEKEIKRQCDFIERAMGLERGATILDVGCGLGMHAVELTSRGYLVVGLDLSLAMLSRAGDEAQDRGLKINFLHGDMREMAFEGAFDAVLCWGTTFGYFDDEANRNVIARMYNALKPGGVLLLDVVNRDFVISKQPNLVWFEGDGCVCMEETSFNHITSRLEVKRTVILDDGRQRETKYSLRLYSLHELGQLLHLQGFRVAEVSGGEATPRVYLGADSPRLIILAERRVRPSSPPSGEHGRPTGEQSIPPAPPAPGEGMSNDKGA